MLGLHSAVACVEYFLLVTLEKLLNYKCHCWKEEQSSGQIPRDSQNSLYFNGSRWDAGILQAFIITPAVDRIEDKTQQEMLIKAGKKEDEKQNERFPWRYGEISINVQGWSRLLVQRSYQRGS